MTQTLTAQELHMSAHVTLMMENFLQGVAADVAKYKLITTQEDGLHTIHCVSLLEGTAFDFQMMFHARGCIHTSIIDGDLWTYYGPHGGWFDGGGERPETLGVHQPLRAMMERAWQVCDQAIQGFNQEVA